MLNLISPLSLRSADAGDQTFLDALYRDSRADLSETFLAPAALHQMLAMQQMSQTIGIKTTYPSAQNWLLLWDTDTVGRLILDIRDSDIRLIDIAVMSGWRGRGIATEVLRALQHYALKTDRSIGLAVLCNNFNARRVYHRAGFILRSTDTLFDQMDWHPAFVQAQSDKSA